MATVSEIRYGRLIERAKSRSPVSTYTELHHIIPKSEGGTNDQTNLVLLTAREHFLAHWLLYRIYRTPASARAFRLMTNGQKRRRGRDYEMARQCMSESMRGDKNVSKRKDVRLKLKENCYSPFAGKRRPDHAILMRKKGLIKGEKNPFFGKGNRQRGEKNHMARKVMGLHIYYGVACWPTASDAAKFIGVSLQAVSQAIQRNSRSKGWRLMGASW